MDDYYLDGEDFAELVKDGSALTERVYAYYMETSDQINTEDWSELSELTKNYIDDRWKKQRAMTKDVPLYGNSFEYARANGEEELYRRSLQANIECRHEIEQAINKNFDGYRLNKGFERELVEKFGMERVAYVLASTVQSHDWDGRFSPETKAWAKAVAVREDMEHRYQFEVASHPAVLDGFIVRIHAMEKETKKEQKEMQEERYRTETARGLPVVHIERDKYGHDIAIVKRQKDYVVAVGYDVKDGTWAQGRYDFVSQESAQAFIDGKYKPQAERKWLTAKVSRDALIRRYDRHSFMRMPNGEYEGYTYNIYNSRVKESRQLVDMESDGRELCYELVFPADGEVTVKNRDGDEVVFLAQEFVEIIGGTSNKDYERRERADDTSWYAISVRHIRAVDNVLVIEPNEAEIVRDIYRLYLSGRGITVILKYLQSERAPGLNWSENGINYILRNERYIGDSLWQKSFVPNILPLRQQRNKGELPKYYCENTHEAIISKEEFESVRALMKSRSNYYKPPNKHRKFLSGKICCRQCGWKYKRRYKAGELRWTCSRKGKDIRVCHAPQLSDTEIREAFVRLFNILKQNERTLIVETITQLQTLKTKINSGNNAILEIDEELMSLSQKNATYGELFMQGVIDHTLFVQQTDVLNQKIYELRTRRSKLISEDDDEKCIERMRELRKIISSSGYLVSMDESLFDSII